MNMQEINARVLSNGMTRLDWWTKLNIGQDPVPCEVNARKILDTSLPGRQCVDISGLLPGSVRKLDLFAAGAGKKTLIPPEAGKILGDMLEHYIPLLTAMDPACEWFGRIFEELLAPPPGANREGRSSRKQTGSFYTPLPVA